MSWLVVGFVALPLVAACSGDAPAATATPRFAPGEAAALVKRILTDDSLNCALLARGITFGGWEGSYESDGVWLVSKTHSYAPPGIRRGEIEVTSTFRVYEATETIEHHSGPVRCLP